MYNEKNQIIIVSSVTYLRHMEWMTRGLTTRKNNKDHNTLLVGIWIRKYMNKVNASSRTFTLTTNFPVETDKTLRVLRVGMSRLIICVSYTIHSPSLHDTNLVVETVVGQGRDVVCQPYGNPPNKFEGLGVKR